MFAVVSYQRGVSGKPLYVTGPFSNQVKAAEFSESAKTWWPLAALWSLSKEKVIMYRCQICQEVCKGRLHRHIVYRPGPAKEIDREIPVCEPCQVKLDAGIPLKVLMKQNAKEAPLPPPPPPLVLKPAFLAIPSRK